MAITTYLVRSAGKTILIDTGIGAKDRPFFPKGRLPDALADIGVRPDDIDIVANTHMHIDHVGWHTTQQGESFRPTLLVVPVGATVTFPNGDPQFHNVFSYSRAKRFDLGRYPRGESKAVTFDKPGYVKVLCEVHKWMRAGVLVVDNPYYAIVPESGRFRFDGVPAGRYRVVVETFDRRAQADVTIPEGGAANVTLTP